MATTTNFGWETPDDTDLVKDGAAAIRTALGGVDTSFVDLKGGTTGQLLSKASNTDLDYTWVTSGAYTAWTPTWTNLTVGNGTLTARYTQVGKTVRFDLNLVFGSTTSITGVYPSFTLPISLSKSSALINGVWIDAGVIKYLNSYYSETPTIVYLIAGGTTGFNYVKEVGVSATIPFTWGTNDSILVSGSYEVA
jgi:hypothetical protein